MLYMLFVWAEVWTPELTKQAKDLVSLESVWNDWKVYLDNSWVKHLTYFQKLGTQHTNNKTLRMHKSWLKFRNMFTRKSDIYDTKNNHLE